jgi:hypothetical protein
MDGEKVITDDEFRWLFEAAKLPCLIGHPEGCTYGGMSPSGGYWLTVAGCLDHGETCGVCGGGADARFGDWKDGVVLGPIWGVFLCGTCAGRELSRHPEKWCASSV